MSEVERFIEECCVKDPEAKTKRSTLYEAYRAWGGCRALRPFIKAVACHGFGTVRNKDSHVFAGIRLKTSEDKSDEQKRSCFTCEHRDICHVRRSLHSIIDEMGWVLGGSFAKRSNATNRIHETLAEVCEKYQKEVTEKPNALDTEALAKFLPIIWERASYDRDKMVALLADQPVLGAYFHIDSPEVVAVMERGHD